MTWSRRNWRNMGFEGMGFLSFFTCCIKLESCDVVIRCKNSRSMTIFGPPVYIACSSFSFELCEPLCACAKPPQSSIWWHPFVVLNGWQAWIAILVHMLLFLLVYFSPSQLFSPLSYLKSHFPLVATIASPTP